jgi:hypothetical protein
LHADCIEQPAPAGGGHDDGTGVALPHHPAQLKRTSADFRADKTADVIAPFAPVEAGAAENPPTLRFRTEFRTKPGQEAHARRVSRRFRPRTPATAFERRMPA